MALGKRFLAAGALWRHKLLCLYLVLGSLTLLIVLLGVLLGPGSLPAGDYLSIYLGLRLTRLAAAFLVGAALAVSGVVLQGLFNNPLASSSILGTTAGANFGGQLVLLSFGLWPSLQQFSGRELLLPMGCLVGALGALFILLLFCGEANEQLLVLFVGFILSTLLLSLSALVTHLAQAYGEVGRSVVGFTLGGVTQVSYMQILVALPLVIGGLLALWFWGRTLDLLLTGVPEALTLGAEVFLLRRYCIVWVAILTAAAVFIGGSVGFVGIIVPHILRPLVGVVHRRLIPAAAWGGGVFVMFCEMLGRGFLKLGLGVMPLGVITGVIGAPFFLYLLVKFRKTNFRLRNEVI